MAQQDDIIIIRTVEEVTTSILDYFLNIALVTKITEDDLVEDAVFSSDDLEIYNSLSSVAEKFETTSKIYAIARDIFNQKSNNGINQSNVRRLAVIRKQDTDASYEACLNRVGYKNSYFVLVNDEASSDISDVANWVDGYRKILFAQSSSADILTSDTTDIASILKNKKSARTAIYYHAIDTESLCGAMASILASYPVGGKSASYKQPADITVDKLTSTQETNLENKNANFYVPFIGGAGDYSTRELTSANGVVSSGAEIEQKIAIDRTILSLQAGLMDALQEDIPYDDNGGTIVYGKVNDVFATLKNEGIFAEDSVDEKTGEMDKSYTIEVLPRATVKRNYKEYFAQKMFIVNCTVQFAGTGKKVLLTLAY